MRRSAAVITIAILVAGGLSAARAEEPAPIPDDCPVTLPTEPRYKPTPPHKDMLGTSMFLYGSDALFTQLYSDGRWRGIKASTGTRNKSWWYRKDATWLNEYPYELAVTAKRLDADGPMLSFPRINNAIMGEEVAMLLMLELPERGCWQVTGNYKGDALSFVVWVD